ncbi:hypothetical protein [Adonisia turfae]|uniref:hypothetical protein n=1 Tax=Adonisia turfae TaxID=2950184 RepID=UPI0020299C1A|nr:hypothetical protein [Adonisia turfae]
MVPIRDENPVQITPYVTYGPITPNVLGFLYELTPLSSMELTAFFSTWTLVPEQLDRARYLLLYLGYSVLAALTQGYFGMFSDVSSLSRRR